MHGLRSPDGDARAQALEAVDAIGDKRVTRALLALLESEQPAAAPEVHNTLAELAADADPWMRALAVRSVGDVVRHNWQAVVRSVAQDPIRLV